MEQSFAFALPSGSVELRVCASSETGSVRAVNEDSFVAEPPVFIVADGMGGHERGDRASQTVVTVLRERLLVDRLPTSAEVIAAISAANAAVRSLVSETGQPLVSGSTLSGVVLVGNDEGVATHWMTVNVGDSRLYTWNGRVLEQLTVDHSAVQELVDAGVITEDAARVHPERNVITRAVGAADRIEPDIWLLPVLTDESFLICSDGLTKELDDAAIAAVLAAHSDDYSIAQRLVDAANAAGGQDNITAIVVGATLVGRVTDTDSTLDRLAELVDTVTTPRIGP